MMKKVREMNKRWPSLMKIGKEKTNAGGVGGREERG
jgi:hypothetical protein